MHIFPPGTIVKLLLLARITIINRAGNPYRLCAPHLLLTSLSQKHCNCQLCVGESQPSKIHALSNVIDYVHIGNHIGNCLTKWFSGCFVQGVVSLVCTSCMWLYWYRGFQVRCHKKATRIGACAHFGGNFEWGITRMLFCDSGPENPCKPVSKCHGRPITNQLVLGFC